jgi:hypothetical protein
MRLVTFNVKPIIMLYQYSSKHLKFKALSLFSLTFPQTYWWKLTANALQCMYISTFPRKCNVENILIIYLTLNLPANFIVYFPAHFLFQIPWLLLRFLPSIFWICLIGINTIWGSGLLANRSLFTRGSRFIIRDSKPCKT